MTMIFFVIFFINHQIYASHGLRLLNRKLISARVILVRALDLDTPGTHHDFC